MSGSGWASPMSPAPARIRPARWPVLLLVPCLALLAGVAPARSDFAQFFDTLDGEWICEVRQFDAAGQVVWQDRQKRVFRRYLAERYYVQEAWLLRRSTGAWVHAGLQLISFDDESGNILLDSYWSFRAGRNDSTSARLLADGSGLAGTARSDRTDATEPRRYELLQRGGELVERSYSRDEAGREFMDHELTYRRVAAEERSNASGEPGPPAGRPS